MHALGLCPVDRALDGSGARRASWNYPMESATRKLRISALRAQLEARSLLCESFANQFETALTTEQKAELVLYWDQAMQENHTLQLALFLLEKQEREHSVTDR